MAQVFLSHFLGHERRSGEQIADAYGIDHQSFPKSFGAQMLYPFGCWIPASLHFIHLFAVNSWGRPAAV